MFDDVSYDFTDGERDGIQERATLEAGQYLGKLSRSFFDYDAWMNLTCEGFAGSEFG